MTAEGRRRLAVTAGLQNGVEVCSDQAARLSTGRFGQRGRGGGAGEQLTPLPVWFAETVSRFGLEP